MSCEVPLACCQLCSGLCVPMLTAGHSSRGCIFPWTQRCVPCNRASGLLIKWLSWEHVGSTDVLNPCTRFWLL